MSYSKAKLEDYASPLSESEKEQCKHAIDMVKDALVDYGYTIKTSRNNFSDDGYAYYYQLSDSSYQSIIILLQGSYANNTNIKRYSDVDVSIVYNPIIPISLEKYFMNFKQNIYNALYKKFGANTKRKNKSIRIEGNSYRKSIDVVPAFTITSKIEEGIQFLTDDNQKIINYPLKQIFNENRKNKDTRYYFKKYVRIFKNIKMDMENINISSASNIGSFQVESLLWNLPNEVFSKYTTLGYGVEDIIEYLITYKYLIDNFYESNGIKKLCISSFDKYYLYKFVDDLSSYFKYEG